MAIQHQLILDEHGEPTSIVIPIATWRNIVLDHPDLDPAATTDHEVPAEIKRMLDERMKYLQENPTSLVPWEQVRERLMRLR